MSRLGRGPTPRWPQGVGIGLLPHTQVLLPLPEHSAAPGLRAAGVWGGAACPRGGPGQRERDSETAGGQCRGTGTGLPLGRRGFGDTRVTEVPESWSAARHAAGPGWAEGPPTLPGRYLGHRVRRERPGGRIRPGRAEGSRLRREGEGGQAMQHAETPLPPGRDRDTPPSVHSSGAQPWLGRAPIPVSGQSCQVAVPGCPGCQGVGSHTWDALLSWHPRTGMNSAPPAPSTPILTLLPCMTCTSVA